MSTRITFTSRPIDFYWPFRNVKGEIVRDEAGQLVRQPAPDHTPEEWPEPRGTWTDLGDGGRQRQRSTLT